MIELYGKKGDLHLVHGDIIFFDWIDKITKVRNGKADHVGIVEKVEDGKVYTIEGNSGDVCRRQVYDIYSFDILGYGTPKYEKEENNNVDNVE